MTHALVGTTGVRAMLGAFAALGLDGRSILAAAGLTDTDLASPDALLPATGLYRMWAAADRLWGRPGLGLAAAGQVPFGAYEVLDYLMATSGTVGEGLARLVECFPVMTRTARYRLQEDRHEAVCEMVWLLPPQGVMFHVRDFSLALVARRVAHVSARRPERVEISGPPLASPREYGRAFGAAAELRASRNALVFSRESLAVPHTRRDDDLNRTLRRHAQLLLERQGAGPRATVADQVRADLLRTSQVGLASIEDVAARLGMSARTLQRRLRGEGATFDGLGREVRGSLAEAYLGDRGLTIGEIAYLLGFSGPSAFSRAFRRWTGRSPQAFRAARTRRSSAPA